MLLPILLLALFAAFLFLFSLKYLLFGRWLKIWFKASVALLSLLASLLICFIAWDMYHYTAKESAESVASITTNRVQTQQFELVLLQDQGVPLHFEIHGDMWQLDARVLVWDPFWRFLGLGDVYRLERLSGRYTSVRDEQNKPRSLYDLWGEGEQIDTDEQSPAQEFKQWLTTYSWLPGTHMYYGGSTYVPMADGARYGVMIQNGALQVVPDNTVAEEALKSWR